MNWKTHHELISGFTQAIVFYVFVPDARFIWGLCFITQHLNLYFTLAYKKKAFVNNINN